MTLTSISVATAEQIDQIQENLTAYFRIFAGLPGITFVEEEVTWVASTGMPGNMILRARMPHDRVDQQIDELVSRIGQTADAFDWFVFPSCQPPDLGEKVAARGLAGGPDGRWQLVGKIGGPGGTWMLAELAALSSPPQVSHRFRIEPVGDQQMMERWSQATIAGFGHDAHYLQKLDEHPFHAAYTRHGFGAEADSLHYIGYLDDQPVTSGTLLLAGGIAGLFDISTPPVYRRQGFGSAISWAMMQEAQQRGFQTAYVWSSNLGRNVYRGVGFVPTAIGMREYCWQKR